VQPTSEADIVQMIITEHGKDFEDSGARRALENFLKSGLEEKKVRIDSDPKFSAVKMLSSSTIFSMAVTVDGQPGNTLQIQLRESAAKNHNVAVFRDAIFRTALCERSRRDYRHPVGKFASCCPAGRTGVEGGYVLYWTIFAMDVMPLAEVFKSEFEQDWENGLITERFRWIWKGVFDLVGTVHSLGFLFVNFHPNQVGFDPRNKKFKLLMAGGGFIGTATFSKKKNETEFLRRTTSLFAKKGSIKGMQCMDNKRLKKLLTTVEQFALAKADRVLERGGDGPVEYSETDLRKLLKKFEETSTGMIEPQGCDLFLDNSLRPIPAEELAAENVKPDPEMLRVSDTHQILVWMTDTISQHNPKGILLHALQGSQVDAEMITGVGRFLDKDGKCNQPEALRRLAEMVAQSLHPSTRNRTAKGIGDLDFFTLPIWPPDREKDFRGSGFRMHAKVWARPENSEWMKEAKECLRRANLLDGIRECGLAEKPQEMLLMNEGSMGVGVWTAFLREKMFSGWYVGRHRQEPSGRFVGNRPPLLRCCCDVENPYGRYVVRIKSKGLSYCDAEPCSEFPLERLIEYGAPGPFINGDRRRPNIKILRKFAFEFDGEIWIPMQALKTVYNAFLSWYYNHEAEKGRNRM